MRSTSAGARSDLAILQNKRLPASRWLKTGGQEESQASGLRHYGRRGRAFLGPSYRLYGERFSVLARSAAASLHVAPASEGSSVEPVLQFLASLGFPSFDGHPVLLLYPVPIPLWDSRAPNRGRERFHHGLLHSERFCYQHSNNAPGRPLPAAAWLLPSNPVKLLVDSERVSVGSICLGSSLASHSRRISPPAYSGSLGFRLCQQLFGSKRVS